MPMKKKPSSKSVKVVKGSGSTPTNPGDNKPKVTRGKKKK